MVTTPIVPDERYYDAVAPTEPLALRTVSPFAAQMIVLIVGIGAILLCLPFLTSGHATQPQAVALAFVVASLIALANRI